MTEKNKIQFEKSLEKLEKIVQELEEGELSLDDALARYEEGAKTLKQCFEVLRQAEKRVEKLLKDEEGNLAIEPFEEDETENYDESSGSQS